MDVLRAAEPLHLLVLAAPAAVALADDTEVQPDVLVAPRAKFTDRALVGPPLLAVEVFSPSTRRVDLLLKRDRYQAAGIPSSWRLDPAAPSVTVLELDPQGRYVEKHHATGADALSVGAPFPVTLTPASLMA